jgi:hypothetical protein
MGLQQAMLTGVVVFGGDAASSKANDAADMGHVDEGVRRAEDAVKVLDSIVGSVENEKLRGPRATENAINAIQVEMAAYPANDEATRRADATPEMLAQTTRTLTLASAKLATAAGVENHNDVMEAANQMRKAAIDIMRTGRGAIANSPDVCGAGLGVAWNGLCASAALHAMHCLPCSGGCV